MVVALMVALLLASLPVSLADLARFPDLPTVYEQIRRHEDHLLRLHFLRSAHGWSAGQWDRAIAGTRRDLHYWRLLEGARSVPFGFGRVWRLRQLEAIRDLVGPERYYAGWHPVLFPDAEIRPVMTAAASD